MSLFIEIIGWTGAIIMFSAYVMVSTGRLAGTSAAFQWSNALGAALFVINTGWHGAIPSMVLNTIWSAIGFAGLWRGWRAKRTLAGE